MNALLKHKQENFYEITIFTLLGATSNFYLFAPPTTESTGVLIWKMILALVVSYAFLFVVLINVQSPKPSGYVFLPAFRWWRKNGPYEIVTKGTLRYYGKLVDLRIWEMYDAKGYFIGWHEEDGETGEMIFVSKERIPDKQPGRMHWLSRIRSPKLM